MLATAIRDRMEAEVTALDLHGHVARPCVTEDDLAELPEPAQRHFRFMGVVGRPRDWSFELGWTGQFRIGLTAPWRPFVAWQYDHAPSITRIFHIQLRAWMMPVLARDTYMEGAGRMLVRPFDLFTAVDGRGNPFDLGELVTYLNDAVLFAPSMLLTPAATFLPVDAQSYDVRLRDHGRIVNGRVFVDERGAPVNFSTTDRFVADPTQSKEPVRAKWTTPVLGWEIENERPVVRRAQAVWHLPRGEVPYADFAPIAGSLRYNVQPALKAAAQ